MHPPYSPDLNPIELVWARLDKNLQSEDRINVDSLLDGLNREFALIT